MCQGADTMKRKRNLALFCGMLGCLCFGAGDWLMLYGDTAHSGSLYWLTEGAAHIASWRNGLAMALSFPGIVLYGAALFALQGCIKEQRHQKVYHYLTAFGLTPWIALHLFYIMILYLFSWMNESGFAQAAIPVSKVLYHHLSWVVIASEAMMLPPFIYWAYLLATGKSVLPRRMAVSNPLILYLVLYLFKSCLPDSPFQIGFTNGLMSESMLIWFGVFMLWNIRRENRDISD